MQTARVSHAIYAQSLLRAGCVATSVSTKPAGRLRRWIDRLAAKCTRSFTSVLSPAFHTACEIRMSVTGHSHKQWSENRRPRFITAKRCICPLKEPFSEWFAAGGASVCSSHFKEWVTSQNCEIYVTAATVSPINREFSGRPLIVSPPLPADKAVTLTGSRQAAVCPGMMDRRVSLQTITSEGSHESPYTRWPFNSTVYRFCKINAVVNTATLTFKDSAGLTDKFPEVVLIGRMRMTRPP